MEPLLSIIIPCYNGEKYLAGAVNSVLKQPCEDLEILIVDDGSKDASGAVADALAAEHANIRVFHIPNSGVSAARNLGIDHARGRYIGFLDADDVLCRDAFDEEIRDALVSGGHDMLSFSYLTGMEDLCHGRRMPAGLPGLYLREAPAYIRQTEKHFCSYLYSRELFSSVIRFPAGIRYNEDLCFLFLISRRARHIMQYEKPWFVYRINASSVMHTLKGADHILEAIDGIDWCRRNSTEPKDILDCEGNLFACMVKYILLGCMHGTPLGEIREKVHANGPFRDIMADYGKFWVDAESAQLYDAFLAAPKKVWIQYRLKGIAYAAAQRLIRTGVGNVINRKLRYKLSLKDYQVV